MKKPIDKEPPKDPQPCTSSLTNKKDSVKPVKTVSKPLDFESQLFNIDNELNARNELKKSKSISKITITKKATPKKTV